MQVISAVKAERALARSTSVLAAHGEPCRGDLADRVPGPGSSTPLHDGEFIIVAEDHHLVGPGGRCSPIPMVHFEPTSLAIWIWI